jgi:hypothetical protein
MENWLVHWNGRNELVNGTSGLATYALIVNLLVAARDVHGYNRRFVCTLQTSYGGSTVSQATFDAARAVLNAEILSPANQATYGYTAIDVAALPELADFTNPAYYDGDPMTQAVHTRATGGGAAIAALIAGVLGPLVP